MRVSALVLLSLLAVLLLAATPLQTSATLLWGHPYAMFYDREIGSPNYDKGFIYMFDQFGGYAGSAEIDNMAAGGFFATEIWQSLQLAMMDDKLVGVWNHNLPHTTVNDGSHGDLVKFVVTIF